MKFPGWLTDLLQLRDIIKGEDQPREGLKRKNDIEEEIDAPDNDIVPALVHFDRDHGPEFLGFSQPVVQPLRPWLTKLDEPAADQQDAKPVADYAVDIPELVVEFMGDGPGLVSGNVDPFLLELLLNKREGIARAENGGGEQDDGNGGRGKEHEGPVPDADRP